MPRMTGGQALAKSLHREGVRVVFGLAGVQLYHALDALYEEPDIRFITARHEQACAYMADGYARVSGDVGTALVVPGPGLLNASAGMGNAYAASSPVLVVSGQIQRDLIGVNRGVLHEVDDQLESIGPITKWASRVIDPGGIPTAVREAFHQLKTGRPRPVEIEIPPETLAEEADIELLEPGKYERLSGSRGKIEAGARIIAEASCPLIWAGGGVISSGAGEALRGLAEFLQAPVVTTSEGKGAISEKHYLSAGAFPQLNDPVHRLMSRSDLILAVGTRLAFPELLDGQQVVQIDVDPDEIGRNYKNTFGIVGDARTTLEKLYRAIFSMSVTRPSRRQEVEDLRTERLGPSGQSEPQEAFIRAIREAMPDDGILVPGMTQMGYYSRIHCPIYEPRTYLTSSYFGNLGFAFPVALGAKVGRPDKAVVVISGDGGFLFNSQELATAVQYGINVLVIVFNDNAYGNVLRDQIAKFDGRTIGAKLHNPDFVKLAEAYGARGVRAVSAEQLESVMREALSLSVPTLIEVPVGMMPAPY